MSDDVVIFIAALTDNLAFVVVTAVLISVLRLFKEGGVGLGPYAFAPTGADKWRRSATGAAPPQEVPDRCR